MDKYSLEINYWHGDYSVGTYADPNNILDGALGLDNFLLEQTKNNEVWEALLTIVKTDLFNSIEFGDEDLGWSIKKETTI